MYRAKSTVGNTVVLFTNMSVAKAGIMADERDRAVFIKLEALKDIR